MKIEVIYTEQVTYKEIIEISQEEEEKAIQRLRKWYDTLSEQQLIEYYHSFKEFVKEELVHELNLSQYYNYNITDIISSELIDSEEHQIG